MDQIKVQFKEKDWIRYNKNHLENLYTIFIDTLVIKPKVSKANFDKFCRFIFYNTYTIYLGNT